MGAARRWLHRHNAGLRPVELSRGTESTWPSVPTGAFLGFLALSAGYNVAFCAVLRERFLLWQTARVLILILRTISLSPLPLGQWMAQDGCCCR